MEADQQEHTHLFLYLNQNQIKEVISLSVVTMGLGAHSSKHLISFLCKSSYKFQQVEAMSETDP